MTNEDRIIESLKVQNGFLVAIRDALHKIATNTDPHKVTIGQPATASPQPGTIVSRSRLDELMVKYLGGGRENIARNELEIILFALYVESKDRGGLAARATAVMDERLRRVDGRYA